MRPSLVVLAIVLVGATVAGQQPAPAAPRETTEQRDARLAWWREARFGLFIHWGLYAIPAGQWNGKPAGGTGEWILKNAQVPVAEYEKLLPQFNPVKFDAREWVRLAKDAGMKYLVITSKHHDGFALWDSKLTTWDVASTPFKREILKELNEACRAEGLRFCLYHSIMDWHHEDYLPRRPWDKRPTETASFDRFVAYLKGQLTELVDRFQPGVLWFDGEWEDTWTHERGLDLARHVRSLDPKIIMNNRVDKGRNDMAGMNKEGDWAGDFGTPEQEIPATGFPGVDWESCMTMNDTWGFRSDDHHWKSAETMVRMLADIASKGGNFLLNVGPTAEGLIPEPSVERLRTIGRWLQVNGESIYGTSATPFKRLPWRCTARPGKLYVHLFDWPKERIALPGLKNAVTGAWLLADAQQQPLAVMPGIRTVTIGLPDKAPDPMDSVVVVTVQGMPEAEAIPLRQDKDGSLVLAAIDAEVRGGARYEPDKQCLGYWTDPADTISWDVEFSAPGTFTVEIVQACPEDTAGATYTVACRGQKISAAVKATSSWSEFTAVKLGRLGITEPGRAEIVIQATGKPRQAVMNLRSLRLSLVN